MFLESAAAKVSGKEGEMAPGEWKGKWERRESAQ